MDERWWKEFASSLEPRIAFRSAEEERSTRRTLGELFRVQRVAEDIIETHYKTYGAVPGDPMNYMISLFMTRCDGYTRGSVRALLRDELVCARSRIKAREAARQLAERDAAS